MYRLWRLPDRAIDQPLHSDAFKLTWRSFVHDGLERDRENMLFQCIFHMRGVDTCGGKPFPVPVGSVASFEHWMQLKRFGAIWMKLVMS